MGLMAIAMSKYNYFVQKERQGQKFVTREQIILPFCQVGETKSELMLCKNLVREVEHNDNKNKNKKEDRKILIRILRHKLMIKKDEAWKRPLLILKTHKKWSSKTSFMIGCTDAMERKS